MNENNQPQSQQQPSESTQYANQISEIWTDEWRKIKAAFEAGQSYKPSSESSHSPQLPDDCQDYLRGENEQCAFAPDNCKKCSSHSPTEQPGDAGFNKLVKETFHELYPYSSGPHLNELFVMAERATKYERAKQSQEPPPDEYVRGWNDCRNTDLKEQSELVAEMNRMKHYNLDAKREMASLNETIITLEAELEQLRSERDKMRALIEEIGSRVGKLESENDNMREALGQANKAIGYLIDGGKMNGMVYTTYGKIQSALSGGSKQ